MIADVYSVLDRIDPGSFPTEQRERFAKRLYSLGTRLGAQELTEEAYASLEAQGSTSGYYLRARAFGPTISLEFSDEISAEQRARASVAADFLKSKWSAIEHDEKCLRFLFQCEWIAGLGRRPFRGERAQLPNGEALRRSLLNIVKAINSADTGNDNMFRYMETVLSWVQNEEQYASQLWRELARDTDYIDPKRVIRRNMLTDDFGAALTFSGRIEGERDQGRFAVRVDGLGRRIQLLARDFPELDLIYGRTVPSFGIAFNYIGPIADPLVRRSSRP